MTKRVERGRPTLSVILSGLLLAGALAAPLSLAPAGSARAQSSAKSTVDAAKSRGEVGEQADGYIGVRGGAGPAVRAAVAEINSGRRRVYAEGATQTGVTPEATAGAAAVHLIARVPPGQYYQDASGVWMRK